MGKKQTKHQWLTLQIVELQFESGNWRKYSCLLWPFALKGPGFRTGNAYGAVYHKRKLLSASREAWRLAYGDIPKSLHVLHRCDVRRCIRPIHLFLGTTLDNLRDCSYKGRMHPGEQNGQAKLTADQVREARRRLATGESQRSIARAFGIHYNAIWKIAHNLKWQSIR